MGNIVLYLLWEETRDIWSGIALCLRGVSRAKPEGTQEAKGLYRVNLILLLSIIFESNDKSYK